MFNGDCDTSMDPVLRFRISGDFLWVLMASERGKARSGSSRARFSKLPGSVCFWSFYAKYKQMDKRDNTNMDLQE